MTSPPLSFNKDLPNVWDDNFYNDFKYFILKNDVNISESDANCGLDKLKQQFSNPTDALKYFISMSTSDQNVSQFFKCNIPTPTLVSQKKSNVPMIIVGVILFIIGIIILLYFLNRKKSKIMPSFNGIKQ